MIEHGGQLTIRVVNWQLCQINHYIILLFNNSSSKKLIDGGPTKHIYYHYHWRAAYVRDSFSIWIQCALESILSCNAYVTNALLSTNITLNFKENYRVSTLNLPQPKPHCSFILILRIMTTCWLIPSMTHSHAR